MEAVVLLLQQDSEAGPDCYPLKDMTEEEGSVLDFCPGRIHDQLTPIEDVLASHCANGVGITPRKRHEIPLLR